MSTGLFPDDTDDIPLSPISPFSPILFPPSGVSEDVTEASTTQPTSTSPKSTESSSSSAINYSLVPHSASSVPWGNFPWNPATMPPLPQFSYSGPFLQFPTQPFISSDPLLPLTPSTPVQSTDCDSSSESVRRSRKRRSSEGSEPLLNIPQYRKAFEADNDLDELDIIENLLAEPDSSLSADDLSELKKRRRLLKNRNSASQSRARKRSEFDIMKKEVLELRKQMDTLKQQNLILTQENRHLQQTVGYFQQWIQAVTASDMNKFGKTPMMRTELKDKSDNEKVTSIIPFPPHNMTSLIQSAPAKQ
ncbi:hypothetical protein RCL1_008550 [Eukaryota sp. TZLM3-RCL]